MNNIINQNVYGIGKLQIQESCSKYVLLSYEKGFYRPPSYTKPTQGEHSYINCESCQQNKEKLVKGLKILFDKFPFCCEFHNKLLNLKEFNKQDFANSPTLVAEKIIYTLNHITNNRNEENYYTEITDYIEYTIHSFGQMPKGCGSPLFLNVYISQITSSIKNDKHIEQKRKNKLLEFINSYTKPNTNKDNKSTDINVLAQQYNKWLKIFPFNISFFSKLKPKFENVMVITKGKPKKNKYSGAVSFITPTKDELQKSLVQLTNTIITTINTKALYSSGVLTEPDKIKLELIVDDRKLKLHEGYTNNSTTDEQQYRGILKEWFKDEKQFIQEITPLLKIAEKAQESNRIKPKTDTRLIKFKDDETITKLHDELKGYFHGKEDELLNVLQGNTLKEQLLFTANQNQLVEVFKRLHYSGLILDNKTDIKNWLCSTFYFIHNKGGKKEERPLNPSTVHDLLTKAGKDVAKTNRICTPEWLPYIPENKRKR